MCYGERQGKGRKEEEVGAECKERDKERGVGRRARGEELDTSGYWMTCWGWCRRGDEVSAEKGGRGVKVEWWI